MIDFQIFIATYNRPDLICKTIESILVQKGWEFELIISDNSTNDETFNIVKEKYGDSIGYIRREVSVDAISHLNFILEDVTKEYFMIFHDDDTMLTGMLTSIRQAFISDSTLVAIGCNAKTIKGGKLTKTWFLKDEKTNQVIVDHSDMARRYLALNQIVPFPSYVYKQIVAKNIRFDINKGGKYCDVAFIIDVVYSGKILLIAKPLMNYYLHKGQDSFTNDYVAKLNLINYLVKKTTISRGSKELQRFRLKNIYKENLISRELEIKNLFRKRALILSTRGCYMYYVKLLILTVILRFK